MEWRGKEDTATNIPNLIEIYDDGTFNDDGQDFVMRSF